ncbi:receptor-type tyrosine-protein phosphatase S-like isoform X2 [Acropora palmata]|uniref:receptor-type tyrosine-protein phosphatase S-like isoform X2 n=1 Tax=Acropora palmata TaxID=6131 RepID=UPI003DA04132
MAEDASNLMALVFRTFLLLCLTHLSSASCEQDSLGLEDNVLIPDSWLTSSSKLRPDTPAKNGRLNYTAGPSWCALSSDSYPYLEIDLQILHIICAVSTQGNHQADKWVKTFSLQSSTDGRTWTNYTEDNQVSRKIFSGNYDRKTIVKHILFLGIVARYLRFIPGVKHNEACMRAAIFGTPRHNITGNIALFKPTEQLGLYETSYSSYGVDGGRDTNYKMCTHTTGGPNPWWRVDLGRVEDVAEVHILNRNSFITRLNGAEIRVGNSTADGGARNHLCATNTGLGASKVGTFFCKPTASGRYVYIRIPGNGKVVTVCEVEVYSSYLHNLALNQPASQASVYDGKGASLAVDGNKNTDFSQGSCIHTNTQKDPWWRVDLGASHPVAEVFIVNRLCTSCTNDMDAFEIRIGNVTSYSTYTSCGGTLTLGNGGTKPFCCDPPIVGRYVSVVIPGTQKFINVCEVEVYSVRQVSSGVTACRMNSVGVSNSSIIYDQRFSASSSLSSSRASNGRLNGGSAWIPSSNNNNNDYLQIDLGSVYIVCAVATQGNPSANYWTKTYKIEISLDNVYWQWYQEKNTVKVFTGNNQKNEIVKNDLYNPLAVKFIRFYPEDFNRNKALRVEVFGSKQTCFSSLGNEKGVTSPQFSVTASTELDNSHMAEDSSLYGSSSWCSKGDASSPQYLQFDFGKVVTVSGIATQGDAGDDKWVTKYAVSYGYDEQSWLEYAKGQHLIGNSDNSSVVGHLFSSPFAAQFVRILPKNHNKAQCMRVDLFGCRDFQVPFLYVNVNNATLRAAHGESVTLNCITKSSKQRPHAVVKEWRKDGVQLADESSSSLTISYSNANDTNNKYRCVPLSSSSREVQCTAVYQCSASLTTVAGLPEIENQGNSTVTVILKKPGQVVGVSTSMVTARTVLVTWTNYSPGEDEAPTSITVRYRNSTSPYHLSILPGSPSSKELTNLKPFSNYSVTVMASSVLGNGLWSNAVTFKTLTAKPSTAPSNIASRSLNGVSYKISWDPLTTEKSNGVVIAYEVKHSRVSQPGASSSSASRFENTTDTSVTLQGWISCSTYQVLVRAYTSAGVGPFSPPLKIVTHAPGPPRDVEAGTPSKRSVTLSWKKPRNGDDVQTYTVFYEGTKSYYPEFKHTNTVETETLSQKITALYPDTKYKFVVATPRCRENSSILTVHTAIDAPPAPPPPQEGPQQIEKAGLSVDLTIWPAAQDNGPISYYQILVHRVQDFSDTVSDWTNFGPDIYISAQIPASEVKTKLIFVLGDGKDKGGYNNKELSSGQKYNIYSRALTTVTSKKRSTDEGLLIGQAQLLAQVQVEGTGKTGAVKGESSTTAMVASVVCVLLVLIVGAVAGVIFWRRRHRPIDRSSKGNELHPMTDVSVNGAYDTIRPDSEGSQPQTPKEAERGEPVGATGEPIYGNAAVMETEDKPKPIPVSQFSEYVTQMRRDKNAGFAKQYKLLASCQQFPWEHAKKPGNKNKNRYANIIAYDHSRVILPLIDGEENSDYVNASYLHGYDSTPNTYIACQGPVPGTYQDFWRMVWQENVTTVVMLTRLVEHGRTKCHQYWPEKAETYRDITVTNHKTETFADYAIRTFILQKKGTQERRQVQQFHFLVWPDKGVPRHATAVLALRRKVRMSHNSNNKNPLVVHCSAGVGRTGAFIVIDAMLESIEKKKVVDVCNYIQLLRNNRISMVQTEEQYVFINMALLESVTCGNTEIPAHDIRVALKKLLALNPKTKMSGLACEYQRLDLITADDVTDIEDDIGRQKKNASKNRFPDIVPLNGSRVILKDANNDYINASYVDTFRERNSFIMTQAPLENTIEDFWKMIWDYNIGTIVMLNEQKEGGQVYPMYWATEGSATFGEFTVETTSHEIFQDFSQREFSVAKKEVGLVDPQTVHQVHHYQITDWPDKGIPKNAQCILDVINMVERSQRKTSNAPLVVQCSDGVGRSGTFCAILSVIERLKSEQVIDVCQSVKVIRVNRPKAVNCKAQYVFCYNMVQRYLDSFNEYANFN